MRGGLSERGEPRVSTHFILPRDVMLIIGLAMDSQEQLDRVGRAKNSSYLSQIDIFYFFSFYLKYTCEITCKKLS